MTLTVQKLFIHLFFMIRIWIGRVILDDQAENSDDHTKLICRNRYREETCLTYYLNSEISRLSFRVKSSCERFVYTVKRQIQ